MITQKEGFVGYSLIYVSYLRYIYCKPNIILFSKYNVSAASSGLQMKPQISLSNYCLFIAYCNDKHIEHLSIEFLQHYNASYINL